MSSRDAKSYLAKRNVPALFECLMTGLMFHRPTDHIQFLIQCLEKLQNGKGAPQELRWNTFVEMPRAKTPLPPISPSNGHHAPRPLSSKKRPVTPKEPPKPKESETDIQKVEEKAPEEAVPDRKTPTPALPPISNIPNVPIVFITGGPGSGASGQASRLTESLPGWVLISVGEELRREVRGQGASGKWKMVSDLMDDGEMVPEDVVDSILLTQLKASPDAKGFIIHGFPRDMEQAKKYDLLVSRVDAVFMVDCEQDTLTQTLLSRAKNSSRLDNNVNTIAKRIQTFKDKTLPALKHYDDLKKLYVVEGDNQEENVAEDLTAIFYTVIGGMTTLPPAPPKRKRSAPPQKPKSPEPPTSAPTSAPTPPLPGQGLSAHLMPPEVKVKDEGRQSGMPTAPIVFVAGGPGSGKGTQCKRLLSRYTKAAHLSMGDILRQNISTQGTADAKWGMMTDLLRQGEMAPEDVTVDLLIKSLKAQPESHFYLIEGFPRNLEQLEDFNKQIGGQSFTLLLDCEERFLHQRLSVRGQKSERIDDNLTAIGKKLTFFRNNTLPILKTIDDDGKLVVINGDRDQDEIFFDISKALDFAIYGTLPEQPTLTTEEKEPVKEEVVEEVVVASSAVTTGDTIANPHHTAQLDSTDDASKDTPAQ